MKKALLALAAIAAMMLSTACGSSSSPSSPSPTTSADVTIQIQADRGSQSYAPNPTTVRVGQTVAWHNADSTAHTATQDANTFNTGTISAGASSSPVMMSAAGTFTYHCTLHPGMVGTIVVQ